MQQHLSGRTLTYHFMWAPARSRDCLNNEIAERLRAIILEYQETSVFTVTDIIIQPGAVFMSVSAPPTIAPHAIVTQIKAYSARKLREEFPELLRMPSLWTRDYNILAGENCRYADIYDCFINNQPSRRSRGRPPKKGPVVSCVLWRDPSNTQMYAQQKIKSSSNSNPAQEKTNI